MVVPRIRGLFRSRKRQTIFILVTVVVVFCFMQFLSLMRLNTLRDGQRQENQKDQEIHTEVKYEEEEKVNGESDEKAKSTEVVQKARYSQLPRGVYVDDAEYYAPNAANIFRCIHTGVEISMEMVNDDYCDCEDSSDEPGTSACPNSRFYCKYQIPYQDAQFLPGSQVNDGICDCCDGSDEWNGRVVPQQMHMSDSQQRALVYQAPCADHCDVVLQEIGEETKLRHQGAQIRRDYLKIAEKLSPADRRRYGPNGAFYKLSSTCFEYHTSEYLYTVCPFTSVKQQKSPEPAVSLGRNPSWEKQKLGQYVLQMLDGDAKRCPMGGPRKTKIFFLCGLENKVLEVAEKERCSYMVKFSTPAACA